MRTDLPSMNSGKGMAQASHASNKFIHDMSLMSRNEVPLVDELLFGQSRLWSSQTDQGFGTVLVLGCSLVDIESVSIKNSSYFSGVVVDPTYPYIVNNEIVPFISDRVHTMQPMPCADGTSVCFRCEVTCAYLFGSKNDADVQSAVGHLSLHP